MRRNMIETVLGGVVLIVAAVFVGFAYSNASLGTSSGYHVTARFDRVGDLKEGDVVKLSGIKVGSVIGQRLDPRTYQAIVTLAIDPDVKLPSDSAAEVASAGLMGGNYISISPGGSDKAIPAGGTIEFTQGAINLMDLVGKAMFSSKGGLGGGLGAGGDGAPAGGVEGGLGGGLGGGPGEGGLLGGK